MKKKFVSALCVLCIALTGCGSTGSNISQSDYDALKAENDDLKNQISDLQSQLGNDANAPTQEATSTSDSDIATENTAQDAKPANEGYEITYQNITMFRDSISTIWSHAIVEVTNTGETDLYLPYGSYELTSQDGTVIHTNSGSFSPSPQVISPGEKGYYFEETTMDEGTPTEGITITPHINPVVATVENKRLEVSSTEIYDKEYGGIDLHGMVKNTTGSEQSFVYITAVLFDSSGQPICQLMNILSNPIKPDEQVGFELEGSTLPEGVTRDSIADYKVFAYPDQMQF